MPYQFVQRENSSQLLCHYVKCQVSFCTYQNLETMQWQGWYFSLMQEQNFGRKQLCGPIQMKMHLLYRQSAPLRDWLPVKTARDFCGPVLGTLAVMIIQ